MHLLELVDTLPDVRYLSKVLHCICSNPISDLEVKFMDLEILLQSFGLNFLNVYNYWCIQWIWLILYLMLDTGLRFYAAPSPPPQKPWGQGHRVKKFMLFKMCISCQSVIRNHSYFNYKYLGGLLPFHNHWLKAWGWRSKSRVFYCFSFI